MFFHISKIFFFALSPFVWFLGLIVFSLIFKKKKKFFRILAFSLLLLFSNKPIQNAFLNVFESEPVSKNALNHCKYGILLGGMSRYEPSQNGTVFYRSVNRLTGALELYNAGIIEKIVITGGIGSLVGRKYPEAEYLKEYLLQFGFPKENLIIEMGSRNTAENAQFTAKQLPDALIGEQILITSAFHMRRSQACFKKAGFSTSPYPTDFYGEPISIALSDWLLPNVNTLASWHIFIKEIIGHAVYKIRGIA